MPESQGHIDLVRSLSAWIERKFRNGSYSFHVIADLPDSREKPDYIGGFRPDVYARAAGKQTILGEAKTVDDLECLHTERQIGAFLKFLSLSPGGVFVMATPWLAYASCNNFVRALAKRDGVQNVELMLVPPWEG